MEVQSLGASFFYTGVPVTVSQSGARFLNSDALPAGRSNWRHAVLRVQVVLDSSSRLPFVIGPGLLASRHASSVAQWNPPSRMPFFLS